MTVSESMLSATSGSADERGERRREWQQREREQQRGEVAEVARAERRLRVAALEGRLARRARSAGTTTSAASSAATPRRNRDRRRRRAEPVRDGVPDADPGDRRARRAPSSRSRPRRAARTPTAAPRRGATTRRAAAGTRARRCGSRSARATASAGRAGTRRRAPQRPAPSPMCLRASQKTGQRPRRDGDRLDDEQQLRARPEPPERREQRRAAGRSARRAARSARRGRRSPRAGRRARSTRRACVMLPRSKRPLSKARWRSTASVPKTPAKAAAADPDGERARLMRASRLSSSPRQRLPEHVLARLARGTPRARPRRCRCASVAVGREPADGGRERGRVAAAGRAARSRRRAAARGPRACRR